MKKLFLLIAIAFTCSSAFAQRSIDLEATMLSPTPGALVAHNTPFSLGWKVTSMGTDTAVAGDTILMAILIDNVTVTSIFQTVLQNSNFMKDSTINYNVNYQLAFTHQSNGNHQICVYGIIKNGSSIVDPNNANNNSCVSVIFGGGSHGVGVGEFNNLVATDVKSYPVPASKYMTISYELVRENNVGIKIYDISGREVMSVIDQKQGAGIQLVPVNTSALETGVYFYELNIGGQVKRTKFVVAN